jgi:sugar phosphate isomerase/epimerase
MQIGLQLYTLRGERAPLRALVERAARLGVECVEGYGIDLAGPDRLARARDLRADVESAGLELSSLHAAVPVGAAERCFEALEETGARILVLPTTDALGGFARDALDDPDGVARYAERLSELADVAARFGARVGYHNHWWEWPGYDALWERADPRVLAEVDLYWAYRAGQDPAALVARLGSRVELVHVKDDVAPGSGDVPLAGALAAGGAITTAIIEADDVDGDVWDYVSGGVAWLRSVR